MMQKKKVSNRDKGRKAEEEALKYLLENYDYKFLAKNFRIKEGEIDLILLDVIKQILIFVEVRSGNCDYFNGYKDSINRKKKDKIVKVAEKFIENLYIEYDQIRFDAIFIDLSNKKEVNYIENIICN